MALDWKRKEKSADHTMNLPEGVEWVLEPVADTDQWRAFKLCWKMNDDTLYWVPLRWAFNSQEAALEGIRRYIASRHPIFVSAIGEIVPT